MLSGIYSLRKVGEAVVSWRAVRYILLRKEGQVVVRWRAVQYNYIPLGRPKYPTKVYHYNEALSVCRPKCGQSIVI